MAVPGISTMTLIVKVHCNGGMVDEIVRGVARTSLLQYPAVYMSTCVINVVL